MTAARILYSSHDSFPSSDTNTQQIFWTIAEVARLGVQVELLVPSVIPGGVGAIAAHYGARAGSMPSQLSIVGVGERRADSAVAKGRFDWRVPRQVKGRRCDLVWTRDPVAAAACVRAGLPLVFETYRPDYATRLAFLPWRHACLTSPCLRGIVAHSRMAAEAFSTAGVPADRIVVAHNGYAPSLMTPALDRLSARRRLGLAETGALVVYAGHAGPDKGIDGVVAMAAVTPEATFLLLGADAHSDDGRSIERAAQAAGARNLILKPRVPVSDVAPYLYAADCLVVPPTDAPLRRFRRTVLPMKVFTYLAAGRPILAPRLPDIEEVLTDGETARLVPPNDTRAAAAALSQLLTDDALRERLSRNAAALAGQYTWEARARRLVGFLDGLVSGPGADGWGGGGRRAGG